MVTSFERCGALAANYVSPMACELPSGHAGSHVRDGVDFDRVIPGTLPVDRARVAARRSREERDRADLAALIAARAELWAHAPLLDLPRGTDADEIAVANAIRTVALRIAGRVKRRDARGSKPRKCTVCDE